MYNCQKKTRLFVSLHNKHVYICSKIINKPIIRKTVIRQMKTGSGSRIFTRKMSYTIGRFDKKHENAPDALAGKKKNIPHSEAIDNRVFTEEEFAHPPVIFTKGPKTPANPLEKTAYHNDERVTQQRPISPTLFKNEIKKPIAALSNTPNTFPNNTSTIIPNTTSTSQTQDAVIHDAGKLRTNKNVIGFQPLRETTLEETKELDAMMRLIEDGKNRYVKKGVTLETRFPNKKIRDLILSGGLRKPHPETPKQPTQENKSEQPIQENKTQQSIQENKSELPTQDPNTSSGHTPVIKNKVDHKDE